VFLALMLTGFLLGSAPVERRPYTLENIDPVTPIKTHVYHAPKVVHKIKRFAYKLYEAGIASWYGLGDGFNGQRTASGVIFNTFSDICAHKYLPLGTKILIENTANHMQTFCRVLDRGPFVGNRILDMSYAIKRKLHAPGLTFVKIYVKK